MAAADPLQEASGMLDRWPGVPRSGPRARSCPEFAQIYENWFGAVRQWVRALGGPTADQQDLAQDVFLIVHQRLHEFDGKNVAGWLYQIARRRVRDFRRLRWFRLFLSRAPLSESLPHAALTPEGQLQMKELEQSLARLLATLPESQRATFVLFEIEGYSGEEIAALQHVPLNTVWGRIHKARKKLNLYSARLSQTERPPLSTHRST